MSDVSLRDPRFVQWAPHVGFVVQHPWTTLLWVFVISAALLPLSIHWALLPFCLWIFLVALKIDWALLDRMAIPPLAILVLLPAVGMGIGIPMYDGSLDVWFSPQHLTMQLVFLFGSPFLFTGYRLGRGKIPENWSPRQTENIFDAEQRPLIVMALFFMLFDLARVTIGWQTGILDRGYGGEALLDQGIGIWTFAGIFTRWNNLWFFFLPFLWRRNNIVMRVLLAICIGYYALISFASGSRGLLIYPGIFTACGLYFFVDKPRFQPERWVPVLLVCVISYTYALDVFRNSVQFQESKLTDLSARLAATSGIVSGAKERQDFAFTTGRALVAVSDEFIYDMTPNEIPFAGAGDILPAIPWTWIPHTLAPNKPLLWDNNEVVVSYTGNRQERTYSAITLSADLYRRFGWVGIPLGLFLIGVAYGYLVRGIIHVYCKVSVAAGVTFVAFLAGGLQGVFTSSVLQTWWIWAYDLPKHLIPLAVIVFFVGGGFGRGLWSYSRSSRWSRSVNPSKPAVFAFGRAKL